MAEEQKYVPGPDAVDISTEKDGGLYKEIITAGTGDETPGKGYKVIVHYVGKLLDGTEFDSSRSRDQKFDFMLGKGSVIKGWDVGVATMKKGEISKLICSSEYAYGAAGSPPKIPPNATLVFEVELFEWELEDLSPNKDGGIQRKIITEGRDYSTPNEGSVVDIHIVGRYNGSVFEDRDVQFEIGDGSDLGIVEGLEIAIQKLKKNETSLIKLTAPYAFRDKGAENFNIPSGADIEYDVTLKSFEKEKDVWQLSPEEKLEQAKLMKEKGTNFFKAEKYSLAAKKYKKICTLLADESKLEGDDLEEKNKILLIGYLNTAACQLKLDDFLEARDSCDKALEMDPNNVKGLFRRGQSFYGIKEYELARKAYLKVTEVDPSNKLAKNQAIICQNHILNFQAKERKTYKNMFEKFAKYDEKHNPKEVEQENKKENGTEEKQPWEEELETVDDAEPIETA